MTFIQLSNIVKSYPDGENRRNEVLRGLNLQLDAGDFVAVMGASGSGKTTLLSIVGLLLPPDGGCYTIEGRRLPASEIERAGLRNRTIGFVFQEHRLLPQYTVLDNILLPVLATQRQADAEQVKYARRLMALTGIAALEAKYPHTLSGGESGRTALCRALVMKPLLLLADEPTGQLDAAGAQHITALLRQVNEELKTTILMVTHSAATASTAHAIRTIENGILA
ncbi:MAG: ATP-binding cassette domain-containing protein [Prevotellaceae bacterium]|jgi:ABC-type lipoprotein export system ATPase subunit|nr:ATP-binding cassette domain-containing protein [Prevotellaceae bacterium]